MDLVIEKDETAAEVFAAQLGGAASVLMKNFEIDAATAEMLVKGGLGDLRSYDGVGEEDIAEIVGNAEVAARIFAKLQA